VFACTLQLLTTCDLTVLTRVCVCLSQVLFEMCKMIADHREELKVTLEAVAQVDVFRAKAKLGAYVKGTIPEVSHW